MGHFTEPLQEKEEHYQWEMLLASQDKPLVTKMINRSSSESWEYMWMDETTPWDPARGWSDGKVFIVSNGSFLLNLPLVNGENRKLADKLIEQCRGDVLFIESDSYGVQVLNYNPKDQPPPWKWMTIAPFRFIIPHFFVLAVILCFAIFPIFGRPRNDRGESTTDFGKHIEAAGKLLEKTGDGDAMLARIDYYQKHVRRDSGKAHHEPQDEDK